MSCMLRETQPQMIRGYCPLFQMLQGSSLPSMLLSIYQAQMEGVYNRMISLMNEEHTIQLTEIKLLMTDMEIIHVHVQ